MSPLQKTSLETIRHRRHSRETITMDEKFPISEEIGPVMWGKNDLLGKCH